MQRHTYNPPRLRDGATGQLWWFGRDRLYHLRRGDRGRRPSEFYCALGDLRGQYQAEEVRR